MSVLGVCKVTATPLIVILQKNLVFILLQLTYFRSHYCLLCRMPSSDSPLTIQLLSCLNILHLRMLIGGRCITNPILDNWHSDEVQPSGESSWTNSSSSNIDQYIMEDEIDDQETEYVVEQYETQANEMEEMEDESCDALMVNSEVVEDNGVLYDDKYEDENQ